MQPQSSARPSPTSARPTRAQGALLFVQQYLRAPGQIGAVAPSSDGLCERMLETIDFAAARTLVEFGPGPGNVTRVIASRLQPTTRFFAIEANPAMAAVFHGRFPGLRLHEGSAANVCEFCVKEGLPPSNSVDAIISGLPWAAFADELQNSILEAAVRVLRPGGQMVTFAYHTGLLMPAGKRFARTLPRHFSKVEKSRPVWFNLPPAFVYRCTK